MSLNAGSSEGDRSGRGRVSDGMGGGMGVQEAAVRLIGTDEFMSEQGVVQ